MGHSSILHPRQAPARHRPPSGLGRHSPHPQPFHFRVCVGVCRGGAQGDAGARGARRAEGKGGLVCSPFPRLAPLTSGCLLVSRCESWGTSGSCRCSPLSPRTPVRKHAAFPQRHPRPPPPANGGGRAEAQRAQEREERSSLPGWAAREREKKLFPPTPGAWSPACAAPRGWELHLRPGREVRAGLWGYLGEE